MRLMPVIKWNAIPDYDEWLGYHVALCMDDKDNVESWMWEAERYIKYLEELI